MARPFGIWTATALVVGGMIGAGIFVLPAQLAPFGWSGIFAWGVAIPGALVLAYVLSRLAAARPAATGAIAIVAEALGPVAGLLVGWSYWIGICSSNAILALTAVRYGAAFAPALTASPLASALGATSIVWALTLLNLGGATLAGRFQVITTLLKLLPLVAVVAILVGLAVFGRGRLVPMTAAPLTTTGLSTASTLAFSAMLGFEGASLVTERLRDPARDVLRATLYGTAATGLLYVTVCAGVMLAVPSATVAAADAPIAMFVATFWGGGAGLAVAAFAAIAVIGCLNGWTLMQGEVPLGMARSGLIPAFLKRTSRRDVPLAAVVISTIFVSLTILSGAVPGMTDILTFMLQLTTAATIWLYVGTCLAALVLGVARSAATIGLGISAWLLWGSGMQALGLSIALMLSALPLYWLRPRGAVLQE